jgi:hypothetical protein
LTFTSRRYRKSFVRNNDNEPCATVGVRRQQFYLCWC